MSWGPLGLSSKSSWKPLGPHWTVLWPSWAVSDASWAALERPWAVSEPAELEDGVKGKDSGLHYYKNCAHDSLSRATTPFRYSSYADPRKHRKRPAGPPPLPTPNNIKWIGGCGVSLWNNAKQRKLMTINAKQCKAMPSNVQQRPAMPSNAPAERRPPCGPTPERGPPVGSPADVLLSAADASIVGPSTTPPTTTTRAAPRRLGAFGGSFGSLESFLGPFGSFLGTCRRSRRSPSSGRHEKSFQVPPLGPFLGPWAPLGPSGVQREPSWALLRGLLGRLGAILGASCAVVGAVKAQWRICKTVHFR